MIRATKKAVSWNSGTRPRWRGMTISGYWISTVKLVDTALSCKAM
jgi:hypothetical protein